MVLVSKTVQTIKDIYKKIKNNDVSGYVLISIGLFIIVTAANLDMANHWLNKPETFFSPPHAAVYTGVAIVIFGSMWVLQNGLYRQETNQNNNADYRDKSYLKGHSMFGRLFSRTDALPLSIKLIFYGVIIITLAGPFDLAWHTAFGLDGLLSPSHATFRIGQALCGLGALLGIVSTYPVMASITRSKQYYSLYTIFIIIAIVPLWRVAGGFISMVTLPFSNTYNFNWNPDPLVAAIIATVFFPFFISLMLYCSFRLVNFNIDHAIGDKTSKARVRQPLVKFGILTITGVAYMTITIFTAILPNIFLVPTIPLYLLSIIPIVSADILLTMVFGNTLHKVSRRTGECIAGGILGLTFFILQYPYIAYTYNEILEYPEIIGPNNVHIIYFKMLDIFPTVAIPSILSGILGVIVGSNLISHHTPPLLVKSK